MARGLPLCSASSSSSSAIHVVLGGPEMGSQSRAGAHDRHRGTSRRVAVLHRGREPSYGPRVHRLTEPSGRTCAPLRHPLRREVKARHPHAFFIPRTVHRRKPSYRPARLLRTIAPTSPNGPSSSLRIATAARFASRWHRGGRMLRIEGHRRLWGRGKRAYIGTCGQMGVL